MHVCPNMSGMIPLLAVVAAYEIPTTRKITELTATCASLRRIPFKNNSVVTCGCTPRSNLRVGMWKHDDFFGSVAYRQATSNELACKQSEQATRAHCWLTSNIRLALLRACARGQHVSRMLTKGVFATAVMLTAVLNDNVPAEALARGLSLSENEVASTNGVECVACVAMLEAADVDVGPLAASLMVNFCNRHACEGVPEPSNTMRYQHPHSIQRVSHRCARCIAVTAWVRRSVLFGLFDIQWCHAICRSLEPVLWHGFGLCRRASLKDGLRSFRRAGFGTFGDRVGGRVGRKNSPYRGGRLS
jgi:hypothetical protein